MSAYRAGTSIRELAERFKINRKTVFEHIEREGLPRRIPALSPQEVEKARSLYQSGQSLQSVSEHFGVAAHTVALALRRTGVEIRKRRGR